jgi:hypothetical protein
LRDKGVLALAMEAGDPSEEDDEVEKDLRIEKERTAKE